MNGKPAEIRHLGTEERKNEGEQKGNYQGAGIPLLTFLNSYVSFLRRNISYLLPFATFLRGVTHSYVASIGPTVGRQPTKHVGRSNLCKSFAGPSVKPTGENYIIYFNALVVVTVTLNGVWS